MSTYSSGLTFKTEKIITKNDIINLCKSLNNNAEYSDICYFEPEAITEGGLIFKFKENPDWYKSIRIHVDCQGDGKWYQINENVIDEWTDNNDIIFNNKTKFSTFLKSFRGAPPFTIKELKIMEGSFSDIGIKRTGKYPTKKSLITDLMF